MADDIDIEEHDILDNPRIQDILRIKEEPIDLNGDPYEEPYNEYNQQEYYTEDYQEGQTSNQIQHYNHELPQNQDELQESQPTDADFDEMEFNGSDMDYNETVESETETDVIPDLSNEIYHHKNKIILGTKPCKRPVRDINGAYVYLEDWRVRLDNSNCFCKECETLFATQNALDAHNMIAHSFLVALDSPVNSEPETQVVTDKTGTAKYCDHCKKYFPSDHALIQHLYDLITANKQTPPVQPTVKYRDCTNEGQHMVYSCPVCNSAYLDIKWFKVHMRTLHNMTKFRNVEQTPFTGVCKICNHTSKYLKRFNTHVKVVHIDKNDFLPRDPVTEINSLLNVIEESTSSNLGLEVKKENLQELEETHPVSNRRVVTGSTVATKIKPNSNFKCIKCKTFYCSIRTIRNHQRQFHRGENIIKRVGPKSIINKSDKSPKVYGAVSQKKPAVKSQDVSDILKLNDNLVPKNCVFKCINCSIHFVTCWSAILHTCVEKISRYECDICSQQFRLKDSTTHIRQHEYNDAFTTYYLTRNMNTKMLFWCQKCAVYFDIKKIQNHTKICNGTTASVRCYLCEVDVSDIVSHVSNHKMHPAKSDFIFIDELLPDYDDEMSPNRDLKRKLPMDAEPGPSKVMDLGTDQSYCDVCHTSGKPTDIKGKPSKSCKGCNKKVSESTQNLNLLENEYLKDDTDVTELINKYETLTSTWNILYLCVTCNVAMDSYDDVVVHCQNHYNNIQNSQSRNCDICSLKLEVSCHKRHRELHSPSITRDSFKTVVFDYKNLLNEDWLKLFGSLSQAEVHQIVTRSIYVTRFVKMKLILNGPPELTIYKCETCKMYVDPYSIYNHTTWCLNVQSAHNKCFVCETCSIPFSTATARKDHELLHLTPNITANSFRIVAFNDKSDREFNNRLQSDAESLEFKPQLPIDINPKIDSEIPKPSVKNEIFYQCRECMCCSRNAQSLIRHTCLNNAELLNCKRCRLKIPLSESQDHRKWHKQNMDSTKVHIKLVLIDNKGLSKTKPRLKNNPMYKLYQCKKCHVCYSFWVKHSTCSTNCRVCKKCGYKFSNKSYSLHKMWHEQNEHASRDDIKVVALTAEPSARSKAERRRFLKILRSSQGNDEPECVIPVSDGRTKVYQCYKCKICSYVVAFVKKHSVCSSNNKGIYHCKICNLKFKFYGMKYHKAWHRENQNFSRKHLEVIPFKDAKKLKINEKPVLKKKKEDSASSIIISDSNGYTCRKCGASSNKTIFLNKHKCIVPEKSKVYPYRYYQCEDCGACTTSKRHYCVPAHKIKMCPKCKLQFTTSSIHDHMIKHSKYKNMTRNNIKVVPFRTNVDMAMEAFASKPAQKVSVVFRCSCGLHFISQKTIERHFTTCSPDHEVPSENCSKCGLLFPTNHLVSHLCNHHSYGKGNIEVKTIPTVTYYRCGSCKCLFMSESRIMNHSKRCVPDKCKSVQCGRCDMDFHETEIKMHRETHKVVSDLNKPCRIVTVNKNSQILDGDESEGIIDDADESNQECDRSDDQANVSYSQFGVRYDNHLHKCSVCDTHFLRLDTYYRHLERSKCIAENQEPCPHCGLHFTKHSLGRHLNVHHENLNLQVEDFVINICYPKGNKLQAKPTPAQHRIAKPNSKTVQHKISKPNETVYKLSAKKTDLFRCHICDAHFVKVISLRNHILADTHTIHKINCPECGIPFHEKSLDLHIALHHKRMKLRFENFNIIEKHKFVRVAKAVATNIEVSEAVSPNISIENEEVSNMTVQDVQEPLETTATESDTEDIIYYNCAKCNVHFTNPRSIENHFDGKHIRNSVETCELCGLSFNSLVRHKMHHENRSSGVFLIQDLNDESETINKLFKCNECGVHFMKHLTLIGHINTRAQSHALKRVHTNCPECGLLLSQRTLKLHQTLHHSKHSLSLKDLVIDTSIGKYRIYKFGSHDNNMVPQSSSEDVSTEHHDSLEKTEEHIPEKNNQDVKSVDASPVSSTKLYKCGECNVYFLTQQSCYKHIVKHSPMDPKEYIECKLCSFQFRIVSLNTHIRKHHNTEFAFDKVLIEEYQPKSEEEKAPKIDIYYAKDKVQSRLISTTTEDSVVISTDVSRIEAETPNDPDASTDSKETVIMTNTDDLDITESDTGSNNAMVTIPPITDVKEESDSAKEIACSVSNTNEDVEANVDMHSNVAPSTDPLLPDKEYTCSFCSETFSSRRAKEFHESLDHLDALVDCPICKKSLNTSVLNEIHLKINNDVFKCCICNQSVNMNALSQHSFVHKHIL